MTPDWQEEALVRLHRRSEFDCGDDALNAHLHRFARQNHESGGAKCFVAATPDGRVLAYYTLSPASIEFARAPEIARKGLGRYNVPVFLLGRLAVASECQGQGLGGSMLMLAARRCIRASQEVGGVGLLIDAKDERVRDWYAAYGALPLADAPLSLVLPFATVLAAASRALSPPD